MCIMIFCIYLILFTVLFFYLFIEIVIKFYSCISLLITLILHKIVSSNYLFDEMQRSVVYKSEIKVTD